MRIKNGFCFFPCIVIFLVLVSADSAKTGTVSRGRKTIKEIVIQGNKSTEEDIILQFLDLDTGAYFDSSMIRPARRRLEQTSLFARVIIFSIPSPETVTLYVMLIEKPYFTISNIGGELLKRYGAKSKVLWQRGKVSLGFTKLNFRGKMEAFTVNLTLLEWRSLGLSWHKPFIQTPYYLNLGAGIADNPSQNYSLREQSIHVHTSVGRRIDDGITIYSGFKPRYANTKVVGKDTQNVTYAESSYAVTTPTGDTSTGYAFKTYVDTIPTGDKRFIETKIFSGLQVDRRDRGFDPEKGWIYRVSFLTNPVYPPGKVNRKYSGYRDSAKLGHDSLVAAFRNAGYTFDKSRELELLTQQYFQIYSQFQLYHRGFFAKDRFAYRLKLLLRDRDGGILNRVGAGGESSIRGYGSGAVDNGQQANNMAAYSMEYRFPIFTTPTFDVFSDIFDFSKIGYDLSNFYYRLDACLFFDAGYVWNKWSSPVSPSDDHQYGYSWGLGLRIMMPTMARSIAFDITPLLRDIGNDRLKWGYWWNLYVDLHY
ncbi:MAG: BamA/TamA family outer membrane protein [Chitinivibrionales bacterium]|nr:BamA/TamA family outer membrane protein [Chitinivibrionales bacterium]